MNEGDLIVPGSDVIADAKLSDIRKRHKAITILGVTDNRRAPNAPHFKVVGA